VVDLRHASVEVGQAAVGIGPEELGLPDDAELLVGRQLRPLGRSAVNDRIGACNQPVIADPIVVEPVVGGGDHRIVGERAGIQVGRIDRLGTVIWALFTGTDRRTAPANRSKTSAYRCVESPRPYRYVPGWLSSAEFDGPTFLWNHLIREASQEDAAQRNDVPVANLSDADVVINMPMQWYFDALASMVPQV